MPGADVNNDIILKEIKKFVKKKQKLIFSKIFWS